MVPQFSSVPSKPVTVLLNWHELYMAATVALLRQITNLRAARQDRYGCGEQSGWQIHIEGASGELAVAKWLQLYWSGSLNKLSAADVDGKSYAIQVRTAAEHRHCLILHNSDSAAHIFVLVTGRPPKYQIVGWCWGRDGKKREFWKEKVPGRPAYFVPQTALNPPETLKKLIWGR